MPLTNFGAILTFAAETQEADIAFYQALAQSPALQDLADLFGGLVKKENKNLKAVLKARRENVTEMILEPIEGFTRAPFVCERGECGAMDTSAALSAARETEAKAVDFYQQAAAKLSALPEAAQALKTVAKRRQKNLAAIDEATAA